MRSVEINARELRFKFGLSQQAFWAKINVTQSGGSRYETGRNIPKPVRELLRLVYVEQIDIATIRKEDFDIIEYLKNNDKALFKQLLREMKAAKKKVK